MKLILNDKSIFKECDNFTARHIIEVFLHTYHDVVCQSEGRINRSIISSQSIATIMISRSYGFPVWRNDKDVDIELIRLFKRICDRQQIEILEDENYEVSFGNIKNGALLIAAIKEYPLLSFITDTKWENSNIDLTIDYITETPSKIITIHNFYNGLNQDDSDWLKGIPQEDILDVYSTPKSLIENMSEVFPNLLFHNTAKKQLENDVQSGWYEQLIYKLSILNNYFQEMNTAYFEKNKFPPRMISEESSETLERFKSKYTFCYADKEYLIKYHIRYTGNSMGRIYFVPLIEERKGLIYSLTTKLPTVSEPKLNI